MAKQTVLAIVAVAAFLIAGAAFVFFQSDNASQVPVIEISGDETPPAEIVDGMTADGYFDSSAQSAPDLAVNESEALPNPDEPSVTGSEQSSVQDMQAAAPNIDAVAALAERTIGAADAPVTIVEYASLSCGHCATFHNTTFPQLKEAFIDTGKVRFTFNDYPLNSPALDGAMVARCLPDDKYFNFIKFLFETQEEWAFSPDYMKNLRQNAKLVGASDALIDACLENDELREGLIGRMQKAAQEHNITSTPSFILNGTVLRGVQSFETLSALINNELKESATAQ